MLTGLAVQVIRERFAGRPYAPPRPEQPALLEPGASFVSLERAGILRGCIGTLEPARPLYLDVARNAARATNDPRLPALTADEWPDLEVTIAVLAPPEPLPSGDLAGLTAALRPGVDGLILSGRGRRATFLPSVWRKLPEPARFVAALLAKGGWSSAEADRLTAQRYAVTEFRDVAPRGPLEA